MLRRMAQVRVGRPGGNTARSACVLVGVLPGPRREDVVLVGERTAGMEVVALQHGGGVAEHEIDGALSYSCAE